MIYTFKPLQDLHGYDNPWPAGGGSNKWDEVWELGSITSEGALTPSTTQIRSKNHIPASAETKYYIVTPAAMTVHYYEVDDTYISNESVTSSKEITTPADCAYMLFSMASTYGTEYKHDISFNNPSTITTYRPYENICPFFGVDVPGIGTVYQGSIDTNSRTLTLTHKLVALKTLTWNLTNVHCFYSSIIADAKTPPNNTTAPKATCSDYKITTTSQAYSGSVGAGLSIGLAGIVGAKTVLIWNANYNSADDFKATLDNANLLYELSTPVEVTLSENQLAVLLGNLGFARNFGSRTNMLNTWMKLAQGHPVSDDELHMLRPSMTLPDDVVLRPTFEDTPLPIVDTPAAEPEENITESEES